MTEISSVPVNQAIYVKKAPPQVVADNGDKTEENPKQYALAAKLPIKPHTKKLFTLIEEWITNYIKRPHKYDPDKIKDGIDYATDILTDPSKPSQQSNPKIDYAS